MTADWIAADWVVADSFGLKSSPQVINQNIFDV